MAKKNPLLQAPPYAVEMALKKLGSNLRTARLRRNLTIGEVAEKIGAGRRAVTDAEHGKASAGIGTYAGLLWAFDMIPHLEEVADPERDREGQRLAEVHGRRHARRRKRLDDDF